MLTYIHLKKEKKRKKNNTNHNWEEQEREKRRHSILISSFYIIQKIQETWGDNLNWKCDYGQIALLLPTHYIRYPSTLHLYCNLVFLYIFFSFLFFFYSFLIILRSPKQYQFCMLHKTWQTDLATRLDWEHHFGIISLLHKVGPICFYFYFWCINLLLLVFLSSSFSSSSFCPIDSTARGLFPRKSMELFWCTALISTWLIYHAGEREERSEMKESSTESACVIFSFIFVHRKVHMNPEAFRREIARISYLPVPYSICFIFYSYY